MSKKSTVYFKKQDLFDMDLPYSAIERQIIDKTRWSVVYEIVFEKDGRFYQTDYSVGATESQDEGPWEYDGDEIACVEVHKVQKMVTVWEPITD